jgi:NosR/NirI family nitrous oxide reductase transcriptional regulator
VVPSPLPWLRMTELARVVAVCTLMFFVPVLSSAQDTPEDWLALLERVVPGAERFSDRQGSPPVFEAYRTDPSSGQETLLGYAFVTSDMPPEQMGFNGPIEALVGMDRAGVLTGVVVLSYFESLRSSRGDFLATPGFQEQFTRKSIMDAFQVRRDVDGISGATITVDATSRGIRNAAREVALAYRLGSVSSATEAALLDPVSVPLAELEGLSWTQMLLRGMAQRILVLDEDRTAADLTLVYLRDDAVAELLIGAEMLGEVLEQAGPLARERHLVLAGVDGPSAGSLNLGRLSVVQGGDTLGLTPPGVLLFGPPRAGKLDGQVRMVRVLLLDPAVDMTRPFSFILDLRPGFGLFSADYPGVRPPVVNPSRVDPEDDAQKGDAAQRRVASPRSGRSGRAVVLFALIFGIAMFWFGRRREAR